MAGVYVFSRGIEEQVDPVLVSADRSISPGTYPGSDLTGGFTVLELPTRDDAVLWAKQDCSSLPLFSGATRVRVRPGELSPSNDSFRPIADGFAV